MNCDQETVFDMKALTAQEREIIAALRSPAKANALYALMRDKSVTANTEICVKREKCRKCTMHGAGEPVSNSYRFT